MRLDDTPVFCQARVTALGSLDTRPGDAEMLGDEIVPWTHLQKTDDDIFAEVDVRGVLGSTSAEIDWLSGDAEVEITAEPRYADSPENLITLAQRITSPASVNKGSGSGFTYDTPRLAAATALGIRNAI